MTIEAFGLFSADDPTDPAFDCPICWSRIYEYPFALKWCQGAIHNTSWGYEGIHVTFKDALDSMFVDVVHSDQRGPEIWDITTPPRAEWLGRFDTLLSISTLEEVRGSHPAIIEQNFLPQVKPDGHVVITFDLPGFQLGAVEQWVGQPVHFPPTPLSPDLARDKSMGLPSGYRVGYLVITR